MFDSIQGRGLAAGATQKYKTLYEAMEMLKANGIVTFFLGHVTKAGQIAGPKTLEHNVDCVIYMRRAFSVRPLFVPKNRFGPAILDPMALVMDANGRLGKSPQAVAKSSSAFGYAGNILELAEVQASVGQARYGSNPKLNAPSLPQKKVSQLIKVLGELKDIELSELSYEVNAYIPGNRAYRTELDLPLTISILASYLQKPVPSTTVFLGELDLLRRTRRPGLIAMERLAQILVQKCPGQIKQVFISDRAAEEFADQQIFGTRVGDAVEVVGVGDLESVLAKLWPNVFP